MLDMRTITAATAVVGALALPATATAETIPDAADGYRGLGPKAVDVRTGSPIPDAADGYRGLGPKAVDVRTGTPIPDAADGYRGLGPKAVDVRTGTPIPDAADGYSGLAPKAVGSRTANSPSDAADGYGGLGEKQVETPQADRPADTRLTPVVHMIDASGEEFRWGDAGIGAAGCLAFIAIAGGIALVATGRRRSTRRVASTS